MAQWTRLVLWGEGPGVPRRGLLFWHSPQLFGRLFPRPPHPACCRGGADRKAARLQQGLPAVCLQNGQGVLQQITVLDNRTETHSLVSPRPASSESSSPTARIQQQRKYKETWGSMGWAGGTLVPQLWSNIFPWAAMGLVWAPPKEHRLGKGFQTSPHQGGYLTL